MNTLVSMAVILFILMLIIGGRKGVRSFVTIFLNFLVLMVSIVIIMMPQANPIIVTLIACIVISYINLFFINEINIKTKTAFLASILTIFVLLVFIWGMTDVSMIQGFGEEEVEELTAFSLYIGIDFVKIAASVIIMSTIGAITDAAMAISSPMFEMHYHNPKASRKELFMFGIQIGKDILGTSANTLFFAFFGAYIALFIWFKDLDYSLGEIINSKIFTSEMITIFCSGTGVALVIPLTAWITAYFFTRVKKRKALESLE